MTNNHPKVKKGAVFPFQVSLSVWADLLGYGSQIAEANFNPLDERSKESVRRIRSFHQCVAEKSGRHFPTLVINDGAAAYRDLSLRSRSVGHDFLQRAWALFLKINEVDQAAGYPGVRMVMACEFRMRGRKTVFDDGNSKVSSILDRFRNGALSAEQAIREASTTRPSFDIVPELQANFAFTKAYVAESSGSRGGLPGANFYLDLSLLKRPLSGWPSLGPEIEWEHPKLGLRTVLARILDIPSWPHPEGGAAEVRDGLEIAQLLAGDVDVLNALRRARKA